MDLRFGSFARERIRQFSCVKRAGTVGRGWNGRVDVGLCRSRSAVPNGSRSGWCHDAGWCGVQKRKLCGGMETVWYELRELPSIKPPALLPHHHPLPSCHPSRSKQPFWPLCMCVCVWGWNGWRTTNSTCVKLPGTNYRQHERANAK